jgi:hypothetical protein
MSTEFSPNLFEFGDIAGNGAWLDGHYRQHLNYNNFLATSLQVIGLTLTSGGTLYATAPAVSITGGGGSGATASAAVSGGSVVSLTLLSVGRGYSSPPSVIFTGGGGSGASATADLSSPILINTYPIMIVQAGELGRKDWLNSHENWHELIRPYANVTSIDLSEVNLDDPNEFYSWLDIHNQEHKFIDQAFGLA